MENSHMRIYHSEEEENENWRKRQDSIKQTYKSHFLETIKNSSMTDIQINKVNVSKNDPVLKNIQALLSAGSAK
jgi:cytidylate kinase